MKNFDAIGSIKYLFELNQVPTDDRGMAFINKNRPELFKKCLNTFLEEIVPEEDGDIQLGYFYSWGPPLRPFLPEYSWNGLTLSIFPTKGIIKSYTLNPEGNFLTNIHRSQDPIVITHIRTRLYIHPDITESHIHWGRRGGVPNKIDGAVLFRQNPVENKTVYEGFEDFVKRID